MAPSTERETFYYVAKLAHKAERYDEMVEAMKNAAKMGKDLTPEGKTLFYVGYKNVIGARRASLGFLSSIERKEESGVYEQRAKWIKEYRCKVESELTDICNDVIAVIDKHLMPACTDEESLVYYYTMKGDHYRYLAEFKTGSDRKEVADLSLKAYEAATPIYLPPTHFLRLELAVKFSLLYNDILNSPNSAWRLTVQAFEEAVSEIQNLHKKSHQDSILIMQLLQDASILYTSEIVDDAVAADAAAEVAESHIVDGAKSWRR